MVYCDMTFLSRGNLVVHKIVMNLWTFFILSDGQNVFSLWSKYEDSDRSVKTIYDENTI